MPEKIPATVITGFLGAGKTTLIRHMLQNAGGRRIALIINEFGDLGVDGEILRGCGIEACRDEDVVELSNGCICCTVADDFVPTLQALLARDAPPDHIVIETSGLALPLPLVRAFNWPEIRTRVTVDGVIAVLDSPAVRAGRFVADLAAVEKQRSADATLDHETPLADLFEDQLTAADMIVANKVDLLAAGELAALTADLRARVRPGVQILPASGGAIDPSILLGLGVGTETAAARQGAHDRHHAKGHTHDHTHDDKHGHAHDDEHGHAHDHAHHDDHDHDAFTSAGIDLPEITAPEVLLDRLSLIIAERDLLRVKGFAAVSGKAMRLVIQAAGPRIETYFDRPFSAEEPRRTRLVVIGLAGLDAAAIAAALAAEPEPAA